VHRFPETLLPSIIAQLHKSTDAIKREIKKKMLAVFITFNWASEKLP
jgi:hypothetical protein